MTKRGLLLASSVLACAFSAAAPARAAQVHVEARNCEGIDTTDVERLLALELSTVRPGPWSASDVMLACLDGAVLVTVRDTLTAKALTRTVSLPDARAMRSELLALAISELFVASWLELLVAVPPARGAERDAQADAERRARSALRPSGGVWQAGVAAAVVVRAPGSPAIREESVTLRVGLAAGRFRVFVAFGVDRGRTETALGALDFVAERAGMGLGWRALEAGPLSLHTTFTASALMLRAEGTSGAPDARGASAGGFGASLTGAVGPALRAGPVRVGLEVVTDLRVPSFVGRVAGGAPTSFSGLAAGGALWASYDLAPF